MPAPNTVHIEYSQGGAAEAKVCDAEGVVHDISAIFAGLKCGANSTGYVNSSESEIATRVEGAVDPKTRNTVAFKPARKEMIFTVDPAAIVQILTANGL